MAVENGVPVVRPCSRCDKRNEWSLLCQAQTRRRPVSICLPVVAVLSRQPLCLARVPLPSPRPKFTLDGNRRRGGKPVLIDVRATSSAVSRVSGQRRPSTFVDDEEEPNVGGRNDNRRRRTMDGRRSVCGQRKKKRSRIERKKKRKRGSVVAAC